MGGVAVTERAPSFRLQRRLLLGGLALTGAALLFAGALLLWPGRPGGDAEPVNAGVVEDYGIGDVTTFEDEEFHLVRLGRDEFIAVSSDDPHSGCTVPWRPQFVFPDRTGAERTGWFRDPCHGSTYDVRGMKVFGPAPRDLDRHPVTLERGNVIVDTSTYVCGFAPPGAECA